MQTIACYCMLLLNSLSLLRSSQIYIDSPLTTAQCHQFQSHLSVQTTPLVSAASIARQKNLSSASSRGSLADLFWDPRDSRWNKKHLKIALGSWKFKKQHNDSFGKGTLKSRTFILGDPVTKISNSIYCLCLQTWNHPPGRLPNIGYHMYFITEYLSQSVGSVRWLQSIYTTYQNTDGTNTFHKAWRWKEPSTNLLLESIFRNQLSPCRIVGFDSFFRRARLSSQKNVMLEGFVYQATFVINSVARSFCVCPFAEKKWPWTMTIKQPTI